MDDKKCPVCSKELNDSGHSRPNNTTQYDCLVCGKFALTTTAKHIIISEPQNQRKSAVISFAIHKMQKQNEWPIIDSKEIKIIIEKNFLPTPIEQSDNLISWIGNESKIPGASIDTYSEIHYSIIGAYNPGNFRFICESIAKEGLLDNYEGRHIKLSFKGWKKYEELKKGLSDSRKAFMAMPFNNPEIDQIFNDCFKPAVKRAGFELFNLSEAPKAGLIDDRMRVEIRTSKFLISELTHGNQGTYWEAGYAEGLGKPVIYTCKKDVFEDEKKKPHFDINHHLTVIWEKNKPDQAADQLVATIRATLPEDAKMTDD